MLNHGFDTRILVKYSVDHIMNFVIERSGTDKVEPDSDIFLDLALTGDDFHEMIAEYSKQYLVDMKTYLWYFHADEEGSSLGSAFFEPPYKKVKRIPVTPNLLTTFANTGKWDIEYPAHSLPKRRYDLIINQIIFALFVLGIIIWIIIT